MNQTPHHFNILKAICAAAHLFGLGIPAVQAAEVIVRDDSSLRQALRACEDQTVLKIGPGQYSGGYSVREVKHLTVEALDSKDPPKFVGGNAGWHFSSCPNLTLRHLHISGQQHNGLNIDDGGQPDRPATDITLEKIEVSEIGPKGNCDGIKCSGLDRLTIRECSIRGWGGQAIDLVGCHDVLIALCHFEGKEGFTASAGVQAKGGSSKVIVEQCEFVDAGGRAINVGGSTGLEFFRPHGAKYEAKDILVRQNSISGSLCAVAFVGVDGAEFTDNKILYPEKWILRILQENNSAGMVKCQNVSFKNNQIVFRRRQVQVEVNVGAGTVPESFRFEGNHWYADDNPQASKPQLPTPEINGQYGMKKPG